MGTSVDWAVKERQGSIVKTSQILDILEQSGLNLRKSASK